MQDMEMKVKASLYEENYKKLERMQKDMANIALLASNYKTNASLLEEALQSIEEIANRNLRQVL